jgi:glutamine amidotransferase
MSADASRSDIVLIDYGIGNLRSVEKALTTVGASVILTDSPEDVQQAQKVVLPGVGAFGDGMSGLVKRQLDQSVIDIVQRGVPLLGICLGMQLLFEGSEEAPNQPGLGLLPGWVRRFPEGSLKVPQTGWNQIIPQQDTPLLQGLPQGSYAYFNHGYYCDAAQPGDWLASTEYGRVYTSVVGRAGIYGVQFHPEKSQQVGLQMLRNFMEYC